MKKRRRIILILIGVGVLVGVLALVLRPAPEPEYGGKKLSEWVSLDHRFGFRGVGRSLNQGFTTPAQEAVRHIGTNAIPYLLKWIRYEKPDWKTKLYKLVNPAIHRIKPAWELTDTQELRAQLAIAGFCDLGSIATAAIPELIKIVNAIKATPQSAVRAVLALGFLGDDALPPLLVVLTNHQEEKLRLYASLSIYAMGTNARPAVPVLIKCLGDKEEGIVRSAALTLYNLKVEPALVISAMVGRLGDTGYLRHWAAEMLGNYGEQARPAVPSLLKLLNDPDSSVRIAATNALHQIDPQALEKATAQ